MPCSTCGAPKTTFHLTQVVSGVRTTYDYCENCAPAEMKQTMQEIKSGTFNPEARWQEKWEELHAEHPEFSTEAYNFVQKALHHDLSKTKVLPLQGSRTISGLLESCQAYAKELYGDSAKAQLKSWGIETFLDVGEIIILLGSSGVKVKRDPALENRLQEIHEKMRKNLRQKYGQSPFLSDES